MADYSSTEARIPNAAPRQLSYTLSHDFDTDDRDSVNPTKVAGAHLNALRNEVAALYQWFRTGNYGIDTLNITLEQGGQVLSSSRIWGSVRLDLDYVIEKVSLGSPREAATLQVDIWRDSHANYPPDNADSICGGNEPDLAAAQAMEDETLTNWDTRINAGDWLIFYLDSNDASTNLTVHLKLRRIEDYWQSSTTSTTTSAP